ncbi:MAG TPA: IS630 transposase-related protein [Gammaproteobacteria bacterium]|nr:IS630 transposase-related protein [Gammaproteobacteria bacterium]
MSKVTPEKKAKFLSVLAGGGSVTLAARAIGIARKNVYAWRNKDEQFKADWNDAVEQGTDRLEDAALERAVKEKSDTMIIFLLKSRRNEKYAERQEHTGKEGGPITLRQFLDEHSGKTLGPPSERGK